MPHYMMKQSGNLSSLLCLPDEILEEIVSELDQHRDLVAFALASRICATLVIPHHTQYRILRVRHTLPDVWAHLARRSDLARNVREVHIQDEKSKWAPDHYPTALIDKCLDRNPENAEESVRTHNLCKALSHMDRLHTIYWSWNNSKGQRPTSHPAHENAILATLSRLPNLKQVSLHGKFAMHALPFDKDPRSLMYPAWALSNLTSLSLEGDSWAKRCNSEHLSQLLNRSPNLESLKLPMEYHHLAECRLPKLRKLQLLLQCGVSDMAIDQSRILFLQNHPSIEELTWEPLGISLIAPGTLPNLRFLQTNMNFITALDDADRGITLTGLMTPPATPVTGVTPVIETPTPTPPKVLRPIESLKITWPLDGSRALVDAKFIRPESLRRLQLAAVEDISTIEEIATTFPNIEWLSLPSTFIMTKREWVDVLPRFKKLQVFRGLGLWQAANNDRQAMHETVIELALACPHLHALDRITKEDILDPYNEITINREGNHVSYSVTKMVRKDDFSAVHRKL